jgi:lysophospholipase L1-like esterase
VDAIVRIMYPQELYRNGYIRNAVSIAETEQGWLPLRFTEDQLKVYSKQENYRIRSECTAGVCLDLMTDSPWLELDYTITGYARDYTSFGVYLDDSWLGTFRSELVGENQRGTICLKLSEVLGKKQIKRVTIYLPHCVIVPLLELRLADQAQLSRASAYSRKLLSMGDSITQGMDAKNPSSSYPVQLSRRLGMEVLNQGVGGCIHNEQVLDGALPWKPDLITLAYGTNDWTQSDGIEQFVFNCRAFYDKLRLLYPDVPVIAWTPLWRSDWEKPRKSGGFMEFGAIMEEIAASYDQVRVLNGLELMPHQPEWFQDGLHPTDEGFQQLTTNLMARL